MMKGNPDNIDDELRIVNRALHVLSGCNQIIIRAVDENILIRDICKTIAETGGYCLVWVGFKENDARKSIRPVARAGQENGYLDLINISWGDTNSEGPVSTAIRTGKRYVSNNLLEDIALKPWCAEAKKRGYASSIALPLKEKEQTFGVLSIYSTETEPFNEEEIRLLTELAGDLSYGIMAIRTSGLRKQAEEALRQSEQRVRLHIDQTPLGVIEWDTHFQVIKWNPASEKIFGYTASEAIGQHARFIVPELYKEHVDQIWNNLLAQKGGNRSSNENVTKDGRTIICEWYNTPLTDANGDVIGVASLVEDITERKQVERYLHLSSEILGIFNRDLQLPDSVNSIVTAIKRELEFDAVGFRLKDVDDFPYFSQKGFSSDFLLTENTLVARDKNGGACRNKDGNISLECTCGLVISGQTDPANPLFTKGGSAWTSDSFPILDIPTEQDPRLHPRNRCIHDGYRSIALVPIRIDQKIVGLLQLNDRKKDRLTLETIHFLEGISSIIGVALMRKKQTEALRLKNIVFDASIAANSIADQRGFISEANEAFLKIWGYQSKEEVVGKPIPYFLQNEDEAKAILSTLDRNGKWEGECTAKRKDGTTFPVYGLATDIRDADNMLIGYQAALMDISERKRAEEERQEMQFQFIQSEKMAAVGLLASSVVHELNNPLMAVTAYSSMLEEQLKSPKLDIDKCLEMLVTLKEGSMRCEKTVKNLLEFSRQSKHEWKPININEALNSTLNILEHKAGMERIKINRKLQENILQVNANSNEMQQVFMNLIINAFDAMKGGGTLTVESKQIDSDHVEFAIADTGKGIPKEHLPKLFEPFFTTKPAGQGTGLGLPIVKKILEGHGAEIGIESEVGKGTRVWMRFPTLLAMGR